jgi:hypothetical protein
MWYSRLIFNIGIVIFIYIYYIYRNLFWSVTNDAFSLQQHSELVFF